MNNNFSKYITLILGILIIWLAGIPFLFSRALPVICENLTYNTPYSIILKQPRLRLNIIPTATIAFKSVSVLSDSSDEKYSAENFKIKIRLLPLLSGRVHLDYITASDVNINTYIKDDIALDSSLIQRIKNTKFKCDKIKILKFKTEIHEKNVKEPALYEGENVFFAKNGRYLQFRIESILNISEKKSVINADLYLPRKNVKNTAILIKLSNLDISPLQNYLKHYMPAGTKSLNGNIDLEADKEHFSILLKNCAYINEDEAKSIILPDILHISSGFDITSKVITIDNAEIKSDNISALVSGKITDYIDRQIPEYNLKFIINQSRVEDFISMLPVFKTEDIDSYKLKKYKFYGDIIGNFSVKGDNLEPSINGSIFINNGILTKPIPNAKGAIIKLDFKDKYLNYDVTVPASQTEKVLVQGNVELYNIKYSDMRVWSTKNVDLAIAEEKVNPLHEILNFIIGPVPIMDIKGRGNIDIKIKGNRKNPHIWGEFNLFDVTTSFNEIPDLVLTNADAVLLFNDENAVFNLKKGLINGTSVNIDGTCNLAGKFDFDVKSDAQKLDYLYKAVNTSTMIDDIKKMIPEIEFADGLINLKLKVYGNIKDITKVKFNENFYTKGSIELLGNKITALGAKITGTKGYINFDNTNADINITSFIGSSPLTLKANIKDKFADAGIYIPRLNLRDALLTNDKLQRDIANIIIELNAKYKGATDKIDYKKINFSAKILDTQKNNKLKVSNGMITLKNDKLEIKDIKGSFTDTNSSFNINLKADNISEKPNVNGKITLKDFELSLINMLHGYALIPPNINNIIKDIRFDSGKINLQANINNNSVYTSTNIGGIRLTYTPLELPLKIVNGSIYMRRNYLGLNKINLIADEMPVLIDGGINDVFDKRNFNLYINSKPKQDFIDKYINNHKIYPVKVKGDILYWIKLKGTADDFDIETEADLAKDSSIYYLGATVGDLENAIVLNLDMNVLKQKLLNINEFSYDKLIESQGKRKTRLNMLRANGKINILKDDLEFSDLRVKTNNPTDAKIFNIIFRKPNIKQGQFTSDLRFNGKLSNPHLLGNFHIVETNIPFMDTTMKNLSFIFRDKTIELSSKGEILGNDVTFKGTLRNKLTAPYYIEKADLYTQILDLNYIIEKLKTAQTDEHNAFDSLAAFDLSNTVIKNMNITANEIKLRNLIAEHVSAKASLNEKKVFSLNDFNFDIAKGSLNGNFTYSTPDNGISLDMKAKDINANDISLALFDLKGQIYGDLTGNVKLSCKGSDFNKCMQTLNGNTTFNVKDGRMPKLGSLEYLLKAGNLVKGGVTGLSLNSIADILTPLKTGNFSDIYGVMNIKDGIANDIEISTKGKDLSLFIAGQYNFADSDAEMEVLGLLSKKISTMLGPIGNVSLNTLFNIIPGVDLAKDSTIIEKINKIPGIELNEKLYRKFIAEIKGDINGDNYVKSFKWIN